MATAPGIDFPYLRRISVTFSGLDMAPGVGAGKTLTYESTGESDKLRISAKIAKGVLGAMAPTKIHIWNLSRDTKKALARERTKITIKAGWDHGPGSGLSVAFTGEYLTAFTRRNGPDYITEINALSGFYALSETAVSIKWRQGQSVREVVKQLAGMLPGVKVDDANIIGIEGVIGEKGWAETAPAGQILGKLKEHYGFDWSIIDDSFYACGRNAQGKKIVAIRQNDLMDVSPILVSPRQFEFGVSWQCRFNPALIPGNQVRIMSNTEPQLNGVYRIDTLAHDLDCFSRRSFITHGSGIKVKAPQSLKI
jgi:hypothetical protein